MKRRGWRTSNSAGTAAPVSLHTSRARSKRPSRTRCSTMTWSGGQTKQITRDDTSGARTWLSTLSSAWRFHSALSTSTLKCFSTVCQINGSEDVLRRERRRRAAHLAEFANNGGELLGRGGVAGHRGIAHLLQARAQGGRIVGRTRGKGRARCSDLAEDAVNAVSRGLGRQLLFLHHAGRILVQRGTPVVRGFVGGHRSAS